MRKNATQVTVRIAFLAAAGLILTFFEFPLLASAPFLKYDASEVPAMLSTFAMGPLAGLATEALKCVLFNFSGKNTTGIVGTSAMFVAGGTYVLVAGAVYRYSKNFKGAILALLLGTASMAVVMYFANVYVFLGLWGIPAEARVPLARSAVLPFNFLKGLLSSLITLVLYKRLSGILHVKKGI